MSPPAHDQALAETPLPPGASLRAAVRPLAGGEGVLVLAAGELDLRGAPLLHEALAGPLREASGPVLLDLSEVSFVDSSGLATLLNALRRLTRAGRRLVLVAPSEEVCRLLAAIRLQDCFCCAPSLQEALDLVGHPGRRVSGAQR